MWLVAGSGILEVVFTIITCFIPPEQIDTGGIFAYEAFLILGTALVCLVPFCIMFFKKTSWQKNREEQFS